MCLPKVKFVNYTWVFVPVNVLLAANIPNSMVYMLNARGSRRHPAIFKMWEEFKQLRGGGTAVLGVGSNGVRPSERW